ncbi:hypothetical protein SEPCBS119000_001654 [Sporothrix epigloea]|uniref:Uncharacterized protein n=1 Tax=Sporothrix epigloea TaxID=1892477 RepID=A0ABP0DEY0_9PEZI
MSRIVFSPSPEGRIDSPPPPAPVRRGDDTKSQIVGVYGAGINGKSQEPYLPYDSMPSLPLQQITKPPPPPTPSQPPEQQQQGSYPPRAPSVPAPMVELPPRPTMSTAGSVVGGPLVGTAGSAGGGGGGQPDSSYGSSRLPPRAEPPMLTQSPGPVNASETMSKIEIRSARASIEQSLGRIMELQRQQRQYLQYGPGAAKVLNSTAAAVQKQLRQQVASASRDLRYVRRAIHDMAKAAENHRFRRWIVGGIMATFIPLVRRLFRRHVKGSDASLSKSTANDTEYAFVRSRSLVDRVLSSVTRRGGLASIAFFVFAVLYIFSNEVSLRVARTLSRRLKKLGSKLERGDEPLDEADLEQLSGWRWRVLLW